MGNPEEPFDSQDVTDRMDADGIGPLRTGTQLAVGIMCGLHLRHLPFKHSPSAVRGFLEDHSGLRRAL